MKTLRYYDDRPVMKGDKFQAPRWGTCVVTGFDPDNSCATARNTQTGESFDLLGSNTFGESDLIERGNAK